MAPNKSTAIFNPQEEIAKQATVHANIEQDLIFTTKDKLLLKLRGFKDAVEYKQHVAASSSVAITLLITLVTSDTKEALGLSAEVWKAIFILAFALSILATIYASVQVFRSRKDRDINTIVKKIMNKEDSNIS